jgi:hypothetical protein
MACTYHYTTAPRDYDYGCTDELRTDVMDKYGTAWRLVVIHDDRGGVFHRGQLPRYSSGCHATYLADDAGAAYLALPTLADLDVDPNAAGPGNAWQEASEAEASRLADDNRAEEAWCLRGVMDALAGRDEYEGAQEAGDEYRLYYIKGHRAASCDY